MKKILTSIAAFALLALPFTALALGVDTNLGATFDLGTAGLQETVIKIVQFVLGLLGLIAVIMILWGGFMWLTAAGNEERIAKAKKIISAAVIGLIVVLLAWAIVIFVVQTTNKVTT